MNTKTPEVKEDLSPEQVPATLPVLPLRDVVIYPYMIFPVLVGRDSSIQAITTSIEADKLLFVCTQREPGDDEPSPEAMYNHGTVAKVLQVLKLPNGLMKVLVDGLFHARVEAFEPQPGPFLRARIQVVQEKLRTSTKLLALVRQMDTLFESYVKFNRNIPNETLIGYEGLDDPMRKLFYVASSLLVPVNVKQAILDQERFETQVYELIRVLRNEIDIMKIEMEIDDKVHSNIQQSQRKYFIQEQIRILQQELGEEDEYLSPDIGELKQRIESSLLPEPVRAKAMEEMDKLRRMPSLSPEATVSRNYLDWIVGLPWGVCSEDNLSVKHADEVLDADHFGLKKPKDRILEHIAVLNLVREMKGQILCFVGPPGVGKTSLGKSIARALNRQFVRIALGGIHDEAEIRGHRRTYIGSMPGKIVQAIKKAGTSNPVILLDEIDKMSNDFHGDPTSAMLEVLDPEQNNSFNDHYLEVDFDLSKVMFITTANVRYNIPLPLQDRMEIIELPGYLEHEKVEIARRHLIDKQIEAHGLTGKGIRFTKPALLKIIREYTMEAGVRNLERSIATICRKLARNIVLQSNRKKSIRIVEPVTVEEMLGVPKTKTKKVQQAGRVGSVYGLAWTSAGGDILQVDVTLMNGAEKLTLTGQLGDVMKESAQAALSYLRSHAPQYDVETTFFEKKEFHIHLPEGAIPKDGPSAGLTMALAMLSAIKRIAPRGDVSMTGEITLHGEVLPIGGLNEKLLAAQRHGIKKVLIPKENEPELVEIPSEVKRGLTILPVKSIDEAVGYVFPKQKKRVAK